VLRRPLHYHAGTVGTEAGNKRTPLYQAHRDLGARIIDFGGWDMPVQYPTGIIKEHQAVRAAVGLFDVSHMGEAVVRGPRATEAVQRLCTNDVRKMSDGAAQYTAMCTPAGGIVDDCIWYRRSEREYLVIFNASNIDKDLAWIREHAGADVEVEDESDASALIAVQGPRAVALCDRLADADLAAVGRFRFADCRVAGVPVMAARTGYTGEDGFELCCASGDAVALWSALLSEGAADGVLPIGLGARDTLRLEARLCLYGNDIDETTTPYEAGLGWVVKLDAGDFLGREALAAQKARGVERKLVGFSVEGRGIARHGYPIVDRERAGDPVIGQVTSGAPGITVGGAIGMGYVPTPYADPGTRITIDCRGKDVAATIVKGPFLKRS
jgi:aminomethyltransferase